MEKFYLEVPSLKRKEDAILYIKEHYEYNSKIIGSGSLYKYLDNYEGWLEKLNQDYITKPSEDRVPARTYFLIRENDDRIIGMINIRLNLNKMLSKYGGHIGYGIRPTERGKGYNKINLYLGLKVCNDYGISRLFLEADLDNPASWKTMEALGGIRVREYYDDVYEKCIVVDYNIDVKKSLEKYKNIYEKYVSNKNERDISTREEILNNFYSNHCDEDKRFESRHGQVEFLTTKKYIEKYLKSGDKILEVGAGTGRYSIYYAEYGYDVTSIEYVNHNLEILKSKIKEGMNIVAEQGDAVDLSRFNDNTFDVTLVLGPLYHLYEDKDINKAISEAIRVTKQDGIIGIAYLTNDSVMIDWALMDDHLIDGYPNDFDDNFQFIKYPEGIFTTFYISEFKDIMSKYDISMLHNVATDGFSNHVKEKIDNLTDEEFDVWMRYHLSTCEREDLQGYSNHMLYICKKK